MDRSISILIVVRTCPRPCVAAFAAHGKAALRAKARGPRLAAGGPALRARGEAARVRAAKPRHVAAKPRTAV